MSEETSFQDLLRMSREWDENARCAETKEEQLACRMIQSVFHVGACIVGAIIDNADQVCEKMDRGSDGYPFH